MNRTWFRNLPLSAGACVLIMLILGRMLSGCSMQRDDHRALREGEVWAEVSKYNGTLLATTAMDTRTVVFMDSPTGKRCHISSIRPPGPVLGRNTVQPNDPRSEPLTVLENWDADGEEARAVLCITINDPALQRTVTRVQLVLAGGTASDAAVVSKSHAIISIPADEPLQGYTLQFFDADGVGVWETELLR